MLAKQNVIDIINMNRLVKKEQDWQERQHKIHDVMGYITAISQLDDGESYDELHLVDSTAYNAVEISTNEQIINAIVALGIEVTE